MYFYCFYLEHAVICHIEQDRFYFMSGSGTTSQNCPSLLGPKSLWWLHGSLLKFPALSQDWSIILRPFSYWLNRFFLLRSLVNCLGRKPWPPVRRYSSPWSFPTFVFPPTRLLLVGQHLHCSHWSITAGCPGACQRVPNERRSHQYGDTPVSGSVQPLFFSATRLLLVGQFLSPLPLVAGCLGAR